MINLLLPVGQKAIRAEYRHRLFIVGGLLTFSLIIIILIIISSFVFILSLHRTETLKQVALARLKFASDELIVAQRLVEETNSIVKILTVAPNYESVTAIYRRLLDKRESGIQLKRLDFSPGQVLVDGRSATRTALLQYLEALQSDSYFQEIKSPVKNIIRERDITFNLIITLRQPNKT